MAAQLLPLAKRGGHPLEHLGGVRAGLPLELRDQRHVHHVLALHPVADGVERVLDRSAELLVRNRAVELAPHRFGSVLSATESAPTKLCPARMAEAMTWRWSGSCSSNLLRSRLSWKRMIERTTNGVKEPAERGEGSARHDHQHPGRDDRAEDRQRHHLDRRQRDPRDLDALLDGRPPARALERPLGAHQNAVGHGAQRNARLRLGVGRVGLDAIQKRARPAARPQQQDEREREQGADHQAHRHDRARGAPEGFLQGALEWRRGARGEGRGHVVGGGDAGHSRHLDRHVDPLLGPAGER